MKKLPFTRGVFYNEWIKFRNTNKKGDTQIKILRIEDIKNIELVENNIK